MQWNCSGKIVMVLDPVRIGMEPLPGYGKTGVSLSSLAEELLSGGNSKYFLFSPWKFGEDFQFDERIFQMGGSNHQLALCLTFFFGSSPSANIRDSKGALK